MLELKNINIKLKERTLIQDLNLRIAPGEIVTIMGRSGSGKSSLLSYVGGDLEPAFSASGEILLDDMPLTALPPEQRGLGRLFQDDLLFPHMTVAENLLFAIPKMPSSERHAMMLTALQRAELQGFEHRAPHTLSGGQRARVALMRSLLAKPKAILLDEPFSKLDQELRQTIRDYTFQHILARNIPALLVTHDKEDVPKSGRVISLIDGGKFSDV